MYILDFPNEMLLKLIRIVFLLIFLFIILLLFLHKVIDIIEKSKNI